MELYARWFSNLEPGLLAIGTNQERQLLQQNSPVPVQRLWDVGVAGIHRLLSNRHVIDSALRYCRGGDGRSLCLQVAVVIAVPTRLAMARVFGLAPLDNAQLLCPGGVVNDNGFGAAILAGQIPQNS